MNRNSAPRPRSRSCRHAPRLLVVAAVLSVLSQLSPGQAYGQCSAVPSSLWANQLRFASDPLLWSSGSDEDPAWAKLTIMLCDPDTVYFQSSSALPFHYEFASQYLEPFLGWSRSDFDLATLYEAGQQAILGAVILPPFGVRQKTLEVGFQLVRFDPYTADEVIDLARLILGSVVADGELRAVYIPTHEQREAAERDRQELLEHGIEVDDITRWLVGSSVYSEGWAAGTLVYAPGGEIRARYLDGRLKPADILLTDSVPSEIPQLAGVLTLEPATPSSHVAILANTFHTPFAYLTAGLADRARAQIGQQVLLLAQKEKGRLGEGDPLFEPVRLVPISGVLSDAQRAELLALKDPPRLAIAQVAELGSLGRSADGLVQGDICYFGGKAANFGTLRRAIPSSAPVALALSFDLFTAFLDQPLGDGRSLRREIADRLEPYSYPPNMAALADDLEAIRDLFADPEMTSFTSDRQAAVIALLQQPELGFDAERQLRFRSSTNVEDSEQFTGAGLYDSYSGCLADDLDADTTGPSLCDPAEQSERGVFRAIRKVFASFYNDNAYLERLRYGVDEATVGMAMLVHHSFPDTLELANGVATVTVNPPDRPSETTIDLVSQAGAVSVTKPAPGNRPETVVIRVAADGGVISLTLTQGSDLVILGASVLDWEDDYLQLAALLALVRDRYAAETGKESFILDLEYKKVAPSGELIVKQLRELPAGPSRPAVDQMYLVNEPTELCAYPAEPEPDPMDFVRAKVRAWLSSASMHLSTPNLEQGLFDALGLDDVVGCRQRSWQGQVGDLPESWYSMSSGAPTLGWSFDDLSHPRSFRLAVTNLDNLPTSLEVVTTRDLRFELEVSTDEPVSSVPGSGTQPSTTTLSLWPCIPTDHPRAEQWTDTVGQAGGLSLTTTYFIIPPPGQTAHAVATLAGFGETTIDGLTPEPIVLHGYFSQSVHLEHIGWSWAVFDPWVEPGIPVGQLAVLLAADIRMIADTFDTGLTVIADADECSSRLRPRPGGDRRSP